MKHFLGLSQLETKMNRETPVMYSPTSLINSHMLVCGMSGTGKSFQCKRLLDSAASSGIEIDIFDVHEELDGVSGCRAVKYSQATGFGYNPLVLSADRHTGGINRQIDLLVGLIQDVGQIGIKQESVLRNLLIDTYAASGITQDNPASWARRQISERERAGLIAQQKWSELRHYYPTLDDLRSFAMRKIKALTIGGDEKSVVAYEEVVKCTKQLERANKAYGRAVDEAEMEKLSAKVDSIKTKAIDAYTAFIASIKTGRELEDILKYDSVEALSSLINRIDILASTGTFRANEPPFGNAAVRVHQIKSLSSDQQVLFVKLRLREIFERRKQEGPTRSGTELRHVIFLDEAHKFFNAKSDDIVNVIAKEARKFGIGLWCASQQPTEFPESFLTNVGATILLGIHGAFWGKSSKMLRITEDQLKLIQPKSVMAIKLMEDGRADPPFQNVYVPGPSTFYNQKAAEMEKKRRFAA